MLRRVIPLVFFFALLLPSLAQAAESPGSWIGSAGQGKDAIYRPDIRPFDSGGYDERVGLACIDEEGQRISSSHRLLLSQIAAAAAEVYRGQFQLGGGAALLPQGSGLQPPANGGYKSGPGGMQAFLRQEQDLLSSGSWVPYSSRSLAVQDGENKKGVYRAQAAGWEIALGSSMPTVDRNQGARLASLLDSSAPHYLLVTSNLPESCGLVQPSAKAPTLQSQLQSPGDFLLDQMLYVPSKIAGEVMSFLQPHAWSFTFFTPHSERGDMMWTVPEACSEESSSFLTDQQIADGCDGGQATGWSESALEERSSPPWFIGAARLLQWMVSGAYLLIICASAVVFIMRGTRNSSVNIVNLVPRIVLSAIVTLFAGFAIGLLVTVSNLLVSTIFSFNSDPTVGALSSILLHNQALVGGTDLLGRIVSLLVSISSAFFYLVFVVASLARQIILVACIVLAPVAAMCLIVPRWRAALNLYLRMLLLAVLLPVALALILKIGMSINPLVIDPLRSAGSAEGVIGLLLAIVTMWLMYRAIRVSLEVAKGGWSAAVPEGVSANNLLASVSKIEKNRERREIMSGERDGVAAQPKAVFLPQERSASPMTAMSPVSSDAAPAPPSLAPEGEAEGSAASSKRISKFIQVRGKRSGKRLSSKEAQDYRQALLKHLEEVQKGSSEPLTQEEIKKAKAQWEQQNGGRLEKENGTWHLRS